MAGEAVGDDVEEHRALVLEEDLLLAAIGLDDGQRVEAVHALGVHLVGVEARAQAREDVVGHGLAVGLAAHAVLVVEDVEQHRQAALHVVLPERVELAHAGHVEGLEHGAATERAVADVGHDDAGLAVDALIERRAHGDGAAAADDGVVGIDAKGREEGVHGAAQAAVEAGLAGEDLAHRAVKQEVDGQILDGGVLALFHHGERLAAEEVLHDVEQLVIREFFNGRQTLGEDVAVGAVGAEDEVVDVEVEGLADSGRFLADAQMGRAGMGVGNAAILAGGLDGLDHRLKLTQNQHVAIDVEELLLGKVAQLILDLLLILVAGDGLKSDLTGFADLIRVDKQLLGHGKNTLLLKIAVAAEYPCSGRRRAARARKALSP